MLAARVAGLVVLGAMSVAYLTHASSLIVAREDGILRLLALTYIPLIIFSGGFGGLSGLPHWLDTLMSYLPAQPMIGAVTRALETGTGQSGYALPGRDLVVLAAWAVGCLLLSVRSFQWDPSSGTRIGLGTRGPPGRREQHERAGAPGGQDRTARPCR
jgi:ABC-2 type transport system permease protein